MNVAILLTGFVRNAQDNADYIIKLCNKYNAKLFVATWDIQDVSKDNIIIDYLKHINESYLRCIYNNYLTNFFIIDYYNYKKTKTYFFPLLRPDDVFEIDKRAKEHGPFFVNRLKDIWFLIKNGKNLIEKYEQENNIIFDLIFKARTDVNITQEINFNINDNIYVPAIIGEDVNDFFAYGNRENMLYYLNLYDYIDDMYINDNIDISYGEHILFKHLTKKNIKFIALDWYYTWGIFNRKKP